MTSIQRRFSALPAWIAPCALCLLAALSPAHGFQRPVVPGEEPQVQKLESARAQLDHASDLKRALRGLEGETRDRARAEAVAAYRAVREFFASDAAACSEAAFRAGELLRSADDATGALKEFGIARDRGAGTDFKVRAMLEIGHLERRAKHAQPALAAYESVVSEETATRRQKDEALLWVGRVYEDQERFDDARRVWQKVADDGEDPLDRVRAFDQIASLLVQKGDLEGAAGTLKRCHEALADVAAEETKLGERVRAALDSMRSPDQVARAVAKRRKQAEANDAERARGQKSGAGAD